MPSWKPPWHSCLPNGAIIHFKKLKMRFLLIFFSAFFLLLSTGAKPKRQKKMAFPFGTWMRSQEEDSDPNAAWLLYRPGSYSFPPARGRSGIMVQKDGKFALLGPSPSDRSDTTWGSWKKGKNNELSIEISGSSLKTLRWKSAGKGRLLIELQ